MQNDYNVEPFNPILEDTAFEPNIEPVEEELAPVVEPEINQTLEATEDIQVEINQPAINFETERPTCTTNPPKDSDTDFNLAFIAENPKTTEKIIEAYGSILEKLTSEEIVLSEKDREWIRNLTLGLQFTSNNEAPIGATSREGSKWTQGIRSNNDILMRPGRPAQRIDRSGAKRYSKEEILSYLGRQAGGGGTYDVMLPCSGLWLRLREPSLSEVVTLITEIEQIKTNVGLDSKGLAFSNTQAVAASNITNLALECVIAANVNFTTSGDLEELISVLDEPILHYALAAVMYPDGFNYKVPCIANVNSCSEVIEFKMNMSNIIWYDNLKFTKEQRRLLERKFSRISTLEELEKYREDFLIGDDKIFWINKIGVKLAIPNLYQRRVYVDAWIESLVEMSSHIFNESNEGMKRTNYINKLNEATKALHYGQWVKGLYEQDETSSDVEDQLISDDPEVIKSFLSDVMSREGMVEKFFDSVAKFSNESITGLVALPSHDCPSCKGTQGNVLNERFPHLVPIDVIPVFFTLAGRKVQKI